MIRHLVLALCGVLPLQPLCRRPTPVAASRLPASRLSPAWTTLLSRLRQQVWRGPTTCAISAGVDAPGAPRSLAPNSIHSLRPSSGEPRCFLLLNLSPLSLRATQWKTKSCSSVSPVCALITHLHVSPPGDSHTYPVLWVPGLCAHTV